MLATACATPPTIELAEGSTRGALTFVLFRGERSHPAGIAAFRVDACDARGAPTPESYWLTLAPDTSEAIGRIGYGVPPAGWRSVQGPQPMVTGCYRAAVAGAPPLEFDVLPDGNARARRPR